MNLIWENPTKKWGTIIQRRIERSWENLFPSGEKISHAKYLGKTQNQNIIDCPSPIIVLETRGILTLDVFEKLAERIRGMTSSPSMNLPAITCAASLAHHSLLGFVGQVRLGDVDLTSVPAEHLVSLASSARGGVVIKNVSGCDLVTILDNVKGMWVKTIIQSRQ